MGNCVEERGKEVFVSQIMDHPSNSGRDLHTQTSLMRALRKRDVRELRKIFTDMENGNFLPDDFQ